MIFCTKFEAILKNNNYIKNCKKRCFQKISKKFTSKEEFGILRNAMVENIACECIQQVYVNPKECIIVRTKCRRNHNRSII